MTKEERREYDRAYKAKNKEKIKEQQRLYHLNNKDRLASRKKEWYSENSEAIKERYESRKDGMYTLYYLPEEHYIGITTNVYNRLKRHKGQGNHSADVEIVAKFDNKREALNTERYMHNIGYNGINKNIQR